MTARIAEWLAKLEAPGTFATRMSAPADDLDIEVSGVGRLQFPITPRIAQKLRSVARPSPFGLREQTLHDANVRNSWEIAASRVKIAARPWKSALASHVRALQVELGLPEEQELKVVFDKLLLYEEGQFFKAHQDSEKSDDMVGSLVVVLPSEYGGGSFTVEHRGEKKTFLRLRSQSKALSLLAFYADCRHEISPISKGIRVALTYQLLLDRRSKGGPPATKAELVDGLTERVREHFATPIVDRYDRSEPAPPDRLACLLDHEYTQRSLTWDRLKNGDRVRVAALRAAAERLDCVVHLALAEVHETWMCEEDYPGGDYGRRWGYRDDDDGEDEDDGDDDGAGDSEGYELVELQDSSIDLHHWVDAGGQHVEGIRSAVDDDELCFTTPSADMEPFKSEHEGYQGNYGNTVDRWYHRAALVMWPRDRTFALQAQMSPQWAVDQLLALPRARSKELESKIRELLPRWKATVGSVEDSRFFARLLKLATRIEGAQLAHEWLSSLGAHRLRSTSARRDLVTLVDKHGATWGEDLFGLWTKDHWRTPEWLPLLADIGADLVSSELAGCKALARALIEHEAKAALGACGAALEHRPAWLDLEAFVDEATRLAHVLAAAVAISELRVVEDIIGSLLGNKPRFPTSMLVQVLRKCVARSPALRDHMAGSPLRHFCVEQLEAVLQAPPRARDDWSIVHSLGCKCAYCTDLYRFLTSKHPELDWPLNKERRRHIHGVIDAAKLPVEHTTLRRGSPQVLQLRKQRTLFTREEDHRAKVGEILRALPADPPAWGATDHEAAAACREGAPPEAPCR